MENKGINFLSRVRLERMRKGLSQKELAEKSGLSANTIFKCEAGKTLPNTATLQKIASALSCDISQVIGAVNVPEKCGACPFFEAFKNAK